MIRQITIKDFKSIHDQTVDMGPVTVLIGRSGAGKSNFVQAIRFLRNYVIAGDAAVNAEGGWAYLLPAGKTKPATTIDVVFTAVAGEGDYNYRISFALQGLVGPHNRSSVNLREEFLALGKRVLFHRNLNSATERWEWTAPPNTVNVPQADGELAIRRIPAVEEIVYAYTALSSSIGYYNLPTSVIRHPSDEKQQKGIIQHLTGLRDDASNYLDVMRGIVRDFQRPEIRKNIIASLRQLNPAVRSIELDSVIQPKHAVVAHDVGGKALDISLRQESDGFRRFYAHLLALYQRPPKLMNVFEEPENGIYPGALELLAEEFKAAPHDGRGQVVLTTHSPQFLDHMPVDDIRVVDMRDGQTVIGPVAPEQKQAVRDNLLSTGELLTVDRARLPEPETADA